MSNGSEGKPQGIDTYYSDRRGGWIPVEYPLIASPIKITPVSQERQRSNIMATMKAITPAIIGFTTAILGTKRR